MVLKKFLSYLLVLLLGVGIGTAAGFRVEKTFQKKTDTVAQTTTNKTAEQNQEATAKVEEKAAVVDRTQTSEAARIERKHMKVTKADGTIIETDTEVIDTRKDAKRDIVATAEVKVDTSLKVDTKTAEQVQTKTETHIEEKLTVKPADSRYSLSVYVGTPLNGLLKGEVDYQFGVQGSVKVLGPFWVGLGVDNILASERSVTASVGVSF